MIIMEHKVTITLTRKDGKAEEYRSEMIGIHEMLETWLRDKCEDKSPAIPVHARRLQCRD